MKPTSKGLEGGEVRLCFQGRRMNMEMRMLELGLSVGGRAHCRASPVCMGFSSRGV